MSWYADTLSPMGNGLSSSFCISAFPTGLSTVLPQLYVFRSFSYVMWTKCSVLTCTLSLVAPCMEFFFPPCLFLMLFFLFAHTWRHLCMHACMCDLCSVSRPKLRCSCITLGRGSKCLYEELFKTFSMSQRLEWDENALTKRCQDCWPSFKI